MYGKTSGSSRVTLLLFTPPTTICAEKHDVQKRDYLKCYDNVNLPSIILAICRISVPIFESVIVAADTVVVATVVVSLVGVIVVNPPAEKGILDVFTGKPAVVSFWHSPGFLELFFPVM